MLIDRYLGGRELEVDAICDGTDVFIPGIMEHLGVLGYIRETVFPFIRRKNITDKMKQKIMEVTKGNFCRIKSYRHDKHTVYRV